MKFFTHIVNTLDRFLSPDLRKLEMRELIRLRFLVFTIIFVIPCSFFPSLLLKSLHPDDHFLIYQGPVNLVVSLILLWNLHSSRNHHRMRALTVLWSHVLFVFNMLAFPTIFSLIYLWSSCLIVFTGLNFGIRGALLSYFGLTTLSLLNITHQYQQNAAWQSLEFDSYVEQILLSLTGSTLFTAIVAGVYEYMRDASDRHTARQSLIAARHAHTGAVGELVGHVAHEVNNPLAILQGSVMRLRRQLEKDDRNHEARKLLAKMQRSHERIIHVQKSLAIFASGNLHEPFISHDVQSILKDVQMAMKPLAQAQQVQLDFRNVSLKQRIRCQPHQLVYVLCCLIQNALDACRDQQDPKIVTVVQDEGPLLRFSVADNGKGIDVSVQERIFQPFFTTKISGNAQGLSLSVCRGILAQHGGDIHFESQPGATTFTFQLPREAGSEIQQARGT